MFFASNVVIYVYTATQHPACKVIFGAVDCLCIVAKLALQVQKEDNSYMSRLGYTCTNTLSSQNKVCGEG